MEEKDTQKSTSNDHSPGKNGSDRGVRKQTYFGRVFLMILTPLQRWRLTRSLYRYIYRLGTVSDLFAQKTERKTRIAQGASQDAFIRWYWWQWEHWTPDMLLRENTWWELFVFNLPWRKKTRESIHQWTARTIEQCIQLSYMERLPSGNLHVGTEGMKIYVWYYPLVAPFKNAIVKAIVISAITLVTTYHVAQLLHIPN